MIVKLIHSLHQLEKKYNKIYKTISIQLSK